MSVKSVRYFIRPRTMNSFNLILALKILAYFFVCICVFSITLMLLNMFVSNVNMVVDSCNVFYICE
jgi:hypothetical protein